jgi:deazaflavin-dependent oxidoreductase (nitroreductase family)
VLGIPDGDGYIVVASNFGQDANPGWYYNLRAHPEVSVADGNAEGAYHARVLSGAERESAYQRALSANPGWKRFQKQAGERAIPVVRLDAA